MVRVLCKLWECILKHGRYTDFRVVDLTSEERSLYLAFQMHEDKEWMQM
jgi:hypothetical protein